MQESDVKEQPSFTREKHSERILESLERLRKDIVPFFDSPLYSDGLKNRFQGIGRNHVFASLKVLEEGLDSGNPDYRRFDEVLVAASESMASYQTSYDVNSDKDYCELKYIYFPGWAYAKKLLELASVANSDVQNSPRAKAFELASIVVLVTVVGYLTNLLKDHDPKINKSKLRNRIVKRLTGFDGGFDFFREFGDLGVYLIYKCVSTTPEDIID